jgi:hypothetical protein
MDTLKALWLKYYGLLMAFLAGWAGEAWLELSAYLKAILP